ncbi:MAG: hypothetical protein A3H36_00965 [Chloroflexi bacterium RIFCSPLOWO2_02_FULL_71_16]|nr:MAG: hypothetical protein A3H36_00965 [Chloroflexi bacterium RIFCSPLOWO2_02_FULL_71_16]
MSLVTESSSMHTVALSNFAVLVISNALALLKLAPCGAAGAFRLCVTVTSPAALIEPKVIVAGLASPGTAT